MVHSDLMCDGVQACTETYVFFRRYETEGMFLNRENPTPSCTPPTILLLLPPPLNQPIPPHLLYIGFDLPKKCIILRLAMAEAALKVVLNGSVFYLVI